MPSIRPSTKKWMARAYAKHARGGRVIWHAQYIGQYDSWEEARIAEIDSKIDTLQYERTQLVTYLSSLSRDLEASHGDAQHVPPQARESAATQGRPDGGDRTPS